MYILGMFKKGFICTLRFQISCPEFDFRMQWQLDWNTYHVYLHNQCILDVSILQRIPLQVSNGGKPITNGQKTNGTAVADEEDDDNDDLDIDAI